MIWASLAPELRDMILAELIQDSDSAAPFATVCQEWQAAIEKHNFSLLKLTAPRLADFNYIATRKQNYVKHIWLCIELLEYDCSECQNIESSEMTADNDRTIRNVIESVFGSLHTWTPKEDLTLDISIYSPSDAKHWFRDSRLELAVVPGFQGEHGLYNIRDPNQGCIHASQVSPLPLSSIQRSFEGIEKIEGFWEGVSEVTAVTCLMLRRQTRRQWDSWHIQRLLSRLPNLQDIHYEPWRDWSWVFQKYSDEMTYQLFKALVPVGLKKIVMFEDFSDTFLALHQSQYPHIPKNPDRIIDTYVTNALAKVSLSLEQLSAAFFVDAGGFFDAYQPNWVWKELVSLTLTSRQLVPDGNPTDINNMLEAAAGAARNMPNLKIMELWNGGKDMACVFQYQAFTNVSKRDGAKTRSLNPASITWRGTWDLVLLPTVTESWKAVARAQYPSGFIVTNEMLGADVVIRSQGDTVRALGLLTQVASPISIWQIQMENYVEGEGPIPSPHWP